MGGPNPDPLVDSIPRRYIYDDQIGSSPLLTRQCGYVNGKRMPISQFTENMMTGYDNSRYGWGYGTSAPYHVWDVEATGQETGGSLRCPFQLGVFERSPRVRRTLWQTSQERKRREAL